MIKRFFISMLGTIAGLWISIMLVVLGGIVLAGALVGSQFKQKIVTVTDKSILHIDLSGVINERYQPESVMDIVNGNISNGGSTLFDIVNAIRIAANDSKIDGIYLECNGSSAATATREEIVEAIDEFKKSGKWVVAYADSYVQGDYLLASQATDIYLNPTGMVDIHGVGGRIPYFKELLDKLGIRMQVIKVGTYKSAVEPYILTDISEPARRQNQVYIDSIWRGYTTTVASGRGVEPAQVDMWADSLVMTWPAESVLDSGIVTKLAYRRNVEDELRKLTGREKDEDLSLISPADYIANNTKKFGKQTKDHVAVLYAVGDIVDSGNEGIVGDDMVDRITELADDDNVKALVLRVNSPGGSAFASEQIWEALEYFKQQNKPYYVSMGDYAASGGYYISCGADRIFADPGTITGSIGVFGMIPDFSGLTDKIGINFATVTSGPNAAFPGVVQPMTQSQTDAMQRYVENTYDLFTNRVAAGRSMSQDSVKAIAEGRVWIGSAAIGLGLVDELGSLSTTIKAIADEVGLEANEFVTYPKLESNPWAQILRETGTISLGNNLQLDRHAVATLAIMDRISRMAPVQARMVDVIISE